MDLEPEQENLLATLVERHRSIADRGRRWFLTLAYLGQAEQIMDGANGSFYAHRLDVDALIDAGYLRVRKYEDYDQVRFVVTPEGIEHYEQRMRATSDPIEAIEEDVMRYIDAAAFREAFPAAYARWHEAADLLWGADSENELTTIGHKVREAMQECATALVERIAPPDVNPDPAKTINRIESVISARSASLGEARTELLRGLIAYWRGLNRVTQRQEHGGPAKQGDELGWEDARRVVLHCAVVMTELARELT